MVHTTLPKNTTPLGGTYSSTVSYFLFLKFPNSKPNFQTISSPTATRITCEYIEHISKNKKQNFAQIAKAKTELPLN